MADRILPDEKMTKSTTATTTYLVFPGIEDANLDLILKTTPSTAQLPLQLSQKASRKARQNYPISTTQQNSCKVCMTNSLPNPQPLSLHAMQYCKRYSCTSPFCSACSASSPGMHSIYDLSVYIFHTYTMK